MATERLRAVFDTNVVIAALKSHSPASPTVELLQRWKADEFDLVYSSELRDEYEETLTSRRVDLIRAQAFLADLDRLGTLVQIVGVEHVVEADPEDDLVVACALSGQATHLVTYDPHFAPLGEVYRDVHILNGLRFLYVVRGDTPPMK